MWLRLAGAEVVAEVGRGRIPEALEYPAKETRAGQGTTLFRDTPTAPERLAEVAARHRLENLPQRQQPTHAL